MTPYYEDESVQLHHGKCEDVLIELPDNSVDAVVTDPPYELAFMGRSWDATGIAYSVDLWRDCLRVLKPGGHLLAFGGSRTWHRLTAAVEDAGFEIRDSIAWLYGSGFPKSLDVSKAIDKAAGAEREVVGRYQPPSGQVWNLANDTAPTGYKDDLGARSASMDITAPATESAQQWQGWGTALKPSHEPVVCAVKPHSDMQILAMIGSHLDALEAVCRQRVSAAEQSSAPTPPGSHAVKIGSAPASAATKHEDELAKRTPTGAAVGSSVATDMSASEWAGETFSSTVTSWRACWAELCSATSMSTTSTATSRTTDLRTLLSCLSRITQSVTAPSTPELDSLRSLVTAADNLFAAGVLNSRSTLALSAIEAATGSTQPSPPDVAARGSSPAFEPIVVARKPLAGTVAANVLEHGTGALNIDATRIGSLPGSAGSSRGGSTACTCPSPGAGRTSHTPSTPPPASSGPSLAGRSDLPASALAGGSRCPRSPGSLGGCLTSPCSCGERAQSPAGVDRASALRPLDAPEYPDRYATGERSRSHQSSSCPNCTAPNVERESNTLGRWPTNVVLDESQAAELDKQTGALHGAGFAQPPQEKWATTLDNRATYSTATLAAAGARFGDSGGASRFFPTFHYEAKAPTSERPRDGETAHPTVKPLDLMRWLVRLVTPPGGTVLEPFAGSGTTAEACVIEGFQCIAIEREADYLPLIMARLNKPIQLGMDFEEPA